jgi:peptidyl-Lys metalloendopeptidase
LEDAAGPTLRILRNGAELKYIGRLARRLPPSESDYAVVRRGSELVTTYDISKNYRLDATGTHEVSVAEPSFSVRVGGGASIRTVHNCGSVPLFVDAAELTVAADAGAVAHTSSELTTSNCSADQIPQIARASSASLMAVAPGIIGQHVCRNCADGYSDDPFYTPWFGYYIAFRGTTISNNYSAIWNAISSDTIKYNCSPHSCRAGDFGYVNGDCAANTVCLCNQFWAGDWVDSQMGTVIHEVSHLKGGTFDYAYGQPDCKALAINRDWEAVMNADNYTFFGEYMYWGPVTAWIRASVSIGIM